MATAKECWRYHIVDRMAPGDDAQAYWIFEARKAYACSTKLAGVLPHSLSNEDVNRFLRSVPMKTIVAEDPSWRCRHWVWEALAHLISNNVITSLPNKPEVVWDTGASFIEGCGSTRDDEEILCYDTVGKRLPSEIGPMKYEH
ncbi:hypothetical protein OG21DRAFT_1508870, partial [Imleria badia]